MYGLQPEARRAAWDEALLGWIGHLGRAERAGVVRRVNFGSRPSDIARNGTVFWAGSWARSSGRAGFFYLALARFVCLRGPAKGGCMSASLQGYRRHRSAGVCGCRPEKSEVKGSGCAARRWGSRWWGCLLGTTQERRSILLRRRPSGRRWRGQFCPEYGGKQSVTRRAGLKWFEFSGGGGGRAWGGKRKDGENLKITGKTSPLTYLLVLLSTEHAPHTL